MSNAVEIPPDRLESGARHLDLAHKMIEYTEKEEKRCTNISGSPLLLND
jgi:hypothetical protein